MSATCATSLERVLPVVGFHSDTKAMRLLLVSVIRLEGAFHVVSPKSKWDYTIAVRNGECGFKELFTQLWKFCVRIHRVFFTRWTRRFAVSFREPLRLTREISSLS